MRYVQRENELLLRNGSSSKIGRAEVEEEDIAADVQRARDEYAWIKT